MLSLINIMKTKFLLSLIGAAFSFAVCIAEAAIDPSVRVYVLSQLGFPNISGYTVSDTGQLAEIPGSQRDLAGGPLALPAQVSFTPDGSQLIVTEKGTRLLDIFTVLANGQTDGPVAQTSRG